MHSIIKQENGLSPRQESRMNVLESVGEFIAETASRIKFGDRYDFLDWVYSQARNELGQSIDDGELDYVVDVVKQFVLRNFD
jgi:hypothetical protein